MPDMSVNYKHELRKGFILFPKTILETKLY